MIIKNTNDLPDIVKIVIILQLLTTLCLGLPSSIKCGQSAAGVLCPIGLCCSKDGFCGVTPEFCSLNLGCQSQFGECGFTALALTAPANASAISPDGSCGPKSAGKFTCPTGGCCSPNGFCGTTRDFCGTGCLSDFGACSASPLTPANNGTSFAPGTPPVDQVPLFEYVTPAQDFFKVLISQSFSISNVQGGAPVARGVVFKQCVSPGIFALTFDDGPGDQTPAILDILKKRGVTATFFTMGENIEHSQRNKDILSRTFNEGHMVASHTYTHPDMAKLTKDQILSEMQKSSDAIYNVLKLRPKYMRFPYGSFSDMALSLMGQLGYVVVDWNLDTNDWKTQSATKVMQEINSALAGADISKDNFISLNHDIQDATLQTVDAIIDKVLAKGMKFVPINECLNDSESPYTV